MVGEVSRLVGAHNLMDVSECDQALVCRFNLVIVFMW